MRTNLMSHKLTQERRNKTYYLRDSSYPRFNVVLLNSCNTSMNLFYIFSSRRRRNNRKNSSRRRGIHIRTVLIVFFRNPKRLYCKWREAWLECNLNRRCCKISKNISRTIYRYHHLPHKWFSQITTYTELYIIHQWRMKIVITFWFSFRSPLANLQQQQKHAGFNLEHLDDNN